MNYFRACQPSTSGLTKRPYPLNCSEDFGRKDPLGAGGPKKKKISPRGVSNTPGGRERPAGKLAREQLKPAALLAPAPPREKKARHARQAKEPAVTSASPTVIMGTWKKMTGWLAEK